MNVGAEATKTVAKARWDTPSSSEDSFPFGLDGIEMAESPRSELANFVAKNKSDRAAAWARVERLQLLCISIRDADLKEISRAQFVMSR